MIADSTVQYNGVQQQHQSAIGESGDESSSKHHEPQKVLVDVQQNSATVAGDTLADKLQADDHMSHSSRSVHSHSQSSSSNVAKASDASRPFEPASLDELKRWLCPAVTLAVASYLSVVMGNFLSYLVRRDMIDREEFQTPLHDYILPEWNPDFDFAGLYVQVSDTFAFAMFLAAAAWAAYERDRYIFARAMGLDSILILGKMIARNLTILPDSVGVHYCRSILEGVNTETPWEAFKFFLSMNYQYCSDMIWSGHTMHLIGGAILFCTLADRHKASYRFFQQTRVRALWGCFWWLMALMNIVFMLLGRAHYSVDIFLAVVITLLAYTNSSLIELIERVFRSPDELQRRSPNTDDEPEPFRFLAAWRCPLDQKSAVI